MRSFVASFLFSFLFHFISCGLCKAGRYRTKYIDIKTDQNVVRFGFGKELVDVITLKRKEDAAYYNETDTFCGSVTSLWRELINDRIHRIQNDSNISGQHEGSSP